MQIVPSRRISRIASAAELPQNIDLWELVEVLVVTTDDESVLNSWSREQIAALDPVMFNEGENECRLETDDDAMRTEITMFSFGKPMPALKPMAAMSGKSRDILSYEAVEPVVYAPSKGLDRPFPVTMRPGEAARLEFEIIGPVKEPMLTVQAQTGKTESARFETTIAEGERLFCKDGATWKVVKGFRTVRTGRVLRPLPNVAGCCRIEVSSADPMSANARINLIKRYSQD